jgi:exosortase/archaeosortase family protein
LSTRPTFNHRTPLAALAIVLAATWDTWRWYAGRVAATPDEAAALATIAALLAGAAVVRWRTGEPEAATEDRWLLPCITGLLLAYAALSLVAPPIVRAAPALVAALLCLHRLARPGTPPLALWGLAALALPVLPTLQFYLGYPLRLLSAALTVPLLQLNGLAVERQGTFLLWRGELLQFDAPCSGVAMLWSGLLLTLGLATWWRLPSGATLLAVAATIVAVVIGNVLRAASLFYLEAGLVPASAPWWHESIGLVAFAAASLVIVAVVQGIRGRSA